ncbi:MAG: glycosyltransferase [Coriobacteriia bacterium]|nr:glycosyltransferase [Coriobacteriia bacterium]MCL2870181.1 glycosyltransferase [Coriobacteriia bacterium]
MRVVMVNKYYPSHVGGIEFHMRDLAEGLVASGHQVRVIVSNDERRYSEELINGVEVVRLPRLFERASTPVCRMIGPVLSFESEQADILHFHTPYPWGEFEWVGQMASKRVPYVVTYHADIVRQRQALAVYGPIFNKFLNRAQLIMASSPQLIQYSPWLNPRADKCRQVNFGLPVESIAHNEKAVARAAVLREELAASVDGAHKPVVLFVGRLIYYKGIEVLARAIPKVDAHFVIIGSGPDRAVIDHVQRHEELAKRIHVIDYASDEDLAAWYHAADVLTLPSVENSEAFGLVQIEAHAAGTPVVSSRLRTGVPYANLDGVTGLTVPPRDSDALAGSLNALLSDEGTRLRLGRQAQARALAEFNIDQMIKGVESVYCEAITLKNNSRPQCPTIQPSANMLKVDRENVDGV